jgi:hypothetical protein
MIIGSDIYRQDVTTFSTLAGVGRQVLFAPQIRSPFLSAAVFTK